MLVLSPLLTNSEVLISFTKGNTSVAQEESQKLDNVRVLYNSLIDVDHHKQDWDNNTLLAEDAVQHVERHKSISKQLRNTLDYIINELLENIFKYATTQEKASLRVVDLPHATSNLFTIRTHSRSSKAHIKNLIKTFRKMRVEHPEAETINCRRSYGWVTITHFNTLVHIIAHKISATAYDLEVVVMVSEKHNKPVPIH